MASNKQLLKLICDDEGFSFPLVLEEVEHLLLDSVVPGVCKDDDCNAVASSCEPDARDNYCGECEQRTVISFVELALAEL